MKKADNISTIFIAGAFILIGLLIRFYLISKYYLNVDEAWHIDIIAQGSILDVINYNFYNNVHPPLYYIILHYWMGFFSDPLTARILSVIPWVFFCIICYFIGETIGGKRSGLIWVFLASFSSGTLYTSLSVSEYQWQILFTSLLFYYFLNYLNSGRVKHLYLYSFCSLVAICLDFSSVLLIFSTGLMLIYIYYKKFASGDRKLLPIILIHIFLSIFTIILYSQYQIHYLGEWRWFNEYYYFNPLILFPGIIFFIMHVESLYFCLISAFIFGGMVYFFKENFLKGSYDKRLLNFILICAVTALLFRLLRIYPVSLGLYAEKRFYAWACVPIFILFSFLIDSIFLVYKKMVVITIMGILIASSAALICFKLSAPTSEQYKMLKDELSQVGKKDIIFTDIGTKMILAADRHFIISGRHGDIVTGRIFGKTIMYIDRYKIDLTNKDTGEKRLGIAIDKWVLDNLYKELNNRSMKDVENVYLLLMGYMQLSSDCKKLVENNDKIAAYNFIYKFSKKDFFKLKECF